jgi:fluoride exporter
MMQFVWVMLGGGIGAALRFAFQLVLGKSNGHEFPTNTLIVNLFGCLMIGIFWALCTKYKWPEYSMLFVFTGLLGGFTTFSSFSLEFFQLMKNNHINLALIYVGLSNFVGLGLSAIGFYIFK